MPRPHAKTAFAGRAPSTPSANRLLRLHAESVGLDPSFTVLDRSDSTDLMDVVRSDLRDATTQDGPETTRDSDKPGRFPRKATCFAIYSHNVNSPVGARTHPGRGLPLVRRLGG